jgi:hypothetical protein
VYAEGVRLFLVIALSWLSLTCLSYAVSDSVVVFNELMYNPPGPDQGQEWLEVHNQMAVNIDLSRWRISGAVDYDFPEGTVIPGGGYLVVTGFVGSLNNRGETLRLRNAADRIMDELDYGDNGDWPVAPDGLGPSLSKVVEGRDGTAENWRPSTRVGGTPGATNFPGIGQPSLTPVVGRQSLWRFRDDHIDLGTAWRATNFVDAAWSQGKAPFDSDATGINALTVTNNLVQRHRASDITGVTDGGVISTWNDTALDDGLAQHTSASGDPRWLDGVANGHAVVRFDGDTDECRAAQIPGINPLGSFAYFIVLRANGGQDNGGVTDGNGDYMFDRHQIPSGTPLVSLKAVGSRFGFQQRYDTGGIGGPVSSTAISQTNFQIVTLRRNRPAGLFELWVDGVREATTADNGSALTPPAMNIGRHSTATGNGFTGDVAELLMYDDLLDPTEMEEVFTYLADRYGTENGSSATPVSTNAPTVYFRTTFDFAGSEDLATLELDLAMLDGGVVYLNGAEILRTNMPGGAMGFTTQALTVVTDPALTHIDLPGTTLVNGSNVLAVELHRATPAARRFYDLRLRVREESPDPRLPPSLALNEISAATDTNRFIELMNLSANPINLDGYVLSLDDDPLREFVFTNQLLAAGEVFSFVTNGLVQGDKVHVRSPDRTQVLDARVATNRLRGRSPVFPDQWLFPATPTPGLGNLFDFNTDVVLNEIMYHAFPLRAGTNFSESATEWIELYNRGGSSVDLSNWELDGAVRYTFPTGTVMSVDGYLVVSNWAGTLSNAGELIQLLDAANNPVDVVQYYDGGRWPDEADGGGASLELKHPFADNDVAESWAGSDESSRTSWTNISFRGVAQASAVGPDAQWRDVVLGLLEAGEILIDDLSVVEDPDGAALQLIDNGSFASGLTAWRPRGNHRHAAVVPDPDNSGNSVLRLIARGPTEHMHNQVEATLRNSESIVNGTTYEISFRARWVKGSNQLLTRLYFNRLPAVHVLPVPLEHGTPGAPNSRLVTNLGPSWTRFGHEPAVPEAGEIVRVRAVPHDPDGINPGSLTLWYRVGSGAWTSTPMAFVTPDLVEADIPGQPANTLVQFYVAAVDRLGASSFFPSAGADSRACYKVQDGLATQAGIHNFRIMMSPEDLAFQLTNIHLMSNERLGCTVIYQEGEIFYDVGVRLKSSERGRVSDNRIGWNLRFQPDHLFRGIHETIAIDRSEGQTVGQREILQDHMMNHAGLVPSKYNDLIKIIAPNPAHTSMALLQLARYGDVFLDGQFDQGSDGDLFEYELIYFPRNADANGYKTPQGDGVVGTGLRDLGDNQENYRWNFLLKNNRTRDDYSRLIDFVRTFDLAGPSFTAAADARIDTDQWLCAMAMAVLTGSGDSYPAGSQHNAYFYVRPSDHKVLYFPHDMDFSYDANRTIFNSPDLNSFVNADPKYRRTYLGYLDHLMNTTWNITYMQPWADHYGQLLPGQTFDTHLTFVGNRSTSVRNQVESNVAPITFAITSNGGSDFGVNAATYTLVGDAWVDIREIRFTGDPAPLEITWTDNNSWAIEVPLFIGPNLIELEGYDFQNQSVVSDSITITNTGALQPAGPGNLVVSELMYHPQGSNDTEYIELMNIGATSIDLSAVQVSEAIDFSFAGQAITLLAPGETVLVVRNALAFEAAYPGLPVAGAYGPLASLANEGERLRVRGTGGQTIRDFIYDDDSPWPSLPDGFGYALELGEPLTNPAHTLAQSWRAGLTPGGTPGRGAGPPRVEWNTRYFTPVEQVNANIAGGTADPDVDGLSNDQEYMLGSDPRSSSSAQLPVWSFDPILAVADVAYRHLLGAKELVYVVRGSNDLGTWILLPVALIDESGPDVDGTQTIRWRVDFNAAFAPMRRVYLRLEARSP